MYDIGLNLACGRGVAPDYNAGIAWLERSAAAGYQPAKAQLVALPREMQARRLNLLLGVLRAAAGSETDSGADEDERHRQIDEHIRRNQDLEFERSLHGGGRPGTPRGPDDN
jgi:TPR repeat protein